MTCKQSDIWMANSVEREEISLADFLCLMQPVLTLTRHNSIYVKSTLVISTSLFSNNRLSRSEIMVFSLTWKSNEVTKYCGNNCHFSPVEKLLLRSNFPSFTQYFQCISNFRSQITYSFVKCCCSIYFFLKSDIPKYFRIPWTSR